MYETELEESINKSMTRTWSHLVDLSDGIKGLGGGGGGCRSQVLKMRRTVKNEKEIEKKEKRRGGETRHPETKAGQKPPSRLRSLVFFRDGFLG